VLNDGTESRQHGESLPETTAQEWTFELQGENRCSSEFPDTVLLGTDAFAYQTTEVGTTLTSI
jgi:hypothetical protein